MWRDFWPTLYVLHITSRPVLADPFQVWFWAIFVVPEMPVRSWGDCAEVAFGAVRVRLGEGPADEGGSRDQLEVWRERNVRTTGWPERNATPPWFRRVSRLLVIHKLINLRRWKLAKSRKTPKQWGGVRFFCATLYIHGVALLLWPIKRSEDKGMCLNRHCHIQATRSQAGVRVGLTQHDFRVLYPIKNCLFKTIQTAASLNCSIIKYLKHYFNLHFYNLKSGIWFSDCLSLEGFMSVNGVMYRVAQKKRSHHGSSPFPDLVLTGLHWLN